MEEGLIQAIRALYENSRSAILFNSQPGEFKTTIGVRQVCLPILFNLFLELIMQKTLHDHHTSISIGGRLIRNPRFAADIDLMDGSNGELEDLTNRPVDRGWAYGMEVSKEKSKSMTSSTNGISSDISVTDRS